MMGWPLSKAAMMKGFIAKLKYQIKVGLLLNP